uniref:Uncharacterized protein n=1 Tax=Apteryx owenii TaxID=8824 RepID=A0A8B9Q9F3_APTOW
MGEKQQQKPRSCSPLRASHVRVPPAARDSSLLQVDTQREGQKCYLYRIMRLYDNKPMRETFSLGHITQEEVRFYLSFLHEADERSPRKVSARKSILIERIQLELESAASESDGLAQMERCWEKRYLRTVSFSLAITFCWSLTLSLVYVILMWH